MKFARTVFRIAGIYGLLVLVPPLFMEAKYGHDFPPPITHPEFFYGFFALGVAWQVLFLVVSTNPLQYRAMMIPAMLEKIGYPLAAFVLFTQGRIDARMFALGSVDWIFLILFAIAYFKTRP